MAKQRLGKEFIGVSLSWGTMREEDLIPVFVNALINAKRNEKVVLSSRTNLTLSDATNFITEHREAFNYSGLPSDFNGLPSRYVDEARYILSDLFDALDEIAPKGCYFGASLGDGSDFGFWEAEGPYF